MTRMTGPDCAVMCNLINIHTYIHTVDSSWAALAPEEDPQGRGIGTLRVEAGAGGEGRDRGGGERGGAWGRGCWTARTMGGSVGNPA